MSDPVPVSDSPAEAREALGRRHDHAIADTGDAYEAVIDRLAAITRERDEAWRDREVLPASEVRAALAGDTAETATDRGSRG